MHVSDLFVIRSPADFFKVQVVQAKCFGIAVVNDELEACYLSLPFSNLYNLAPFLVSSFSSSYFFISLFSCIQQVSYNHQYSALQQFFPNNNSLGLDNQSLFMSDSSIQGSCTTGSQDHKISDTPSYLVKELILTLPCFCVLHLLRCSFLRLRLPELPLAPLSSEENESSSSRSDLVCFVLGSDSSSMSINPENHELSPCSYVQSVVEQKEFRA